MDKPHKGRLYNVEKTACVDYGLGFLYRCRFADHPRFAGAFGHTSYVVWEGMPDETGAYEIETRNSRYTVVN